MLLVVLPFWTSFLIRVYAWVNILQHDGLLNQALIALRIIDAPVSWLATDSAVYIGIVYSYFPFMVLPLYAALEKMDETLLEAAADLGCPPWRAFLAVTVPLSLPGHRGRLAALLHPDHGRVRHPRPARLVVDRDDRADAVARILRQPRLAGRLRARRRAAGDPADADPDLSPARGARARSDARKSGHRFSVRHRDQKSNAMTTRGRLSLVNLTALALGLAFLYLPIAILVINSFNDSRLVTVWGGWSLRWYRALMSDEAMLRGRLGVVPRRVPVGVAPRRSSARSRRSRSRAARRFRGRLLFSGMIYAPLVMPEVITGLSLLLLFVALEIDRGFWTIVIAHTTLTLCFVAVVVQARLVTFDMSLEEAAIDLGCPPLRTFLTVTLPLIWPAVASGWMLAFALSLDDLVLASFVTGPGATTLPIRIYSEVRLGVKPEINAVCTIMIAVVATGAGRRLAADQAPPGPRGGGARSEEL